MRIRLEPEIRKEQIVAAALAEFSTRGFDATTNKDIANRAELSSPGLIYHYFESKQELLQAVIERYSPPIALLKIEDELMKMGIEEMLTKVGSVYLSFTNSPESIQLVRILLMEAVRDNGFGNRFAQLGPLRMLGLMARYFQVQMDRGIMREIDPEIATRAFIGPLMVTLLGRVILGMGSDEPLEIGSTVQAHVEIYMKGVLKDSI